jgi:hypothetical protein
VHQEIEDLLKGKAKLKKKQEKGQLTDEEEIDLEGVAEFSLFLKRTRDTGRMK